MLKTNMLATQIDGLASRGSDRRKAVAAELGDGTPYDAAVRLGNEYLASFDLSSLKVVAKLPDIKDDK